MIKIIDDIKNKNINEQINFFNQCSIEEKIDGHFVSIQIISKNKIKFFKSNKQEVTRVDMILNDMWKKLINEWNLILFGNKQYLETHIGYLYNIFFIPNKKTLNTIYKSGITYIIHRISINNIEKDYYKDFINLIKIPQILKETNSDNFIVPQLKNIKIKQEKNFYKNNLQLWNNNQLSTNEFLFKLINKNSLYSENLPEGLIFRNKNIVYQFLCTDYIFKKDIYSKSPCEFILINFLKFCKLHQNYIDLITKDYVKSVCNIFEEYINFVNVKEIEKNININDLEPPYLGSKPLINYEYIPNEKTKTLCQLNKFYENIFKILLVNLKKYKNEKFCILMNKEQCQNLNIIIKNIISKSF